MTQADEILSELDLLSLGERLPLMETELQRLHERLARRQADIWKGKTIEELAEEQGVRPIHNLMDLRLDVWPEDESVDDFIATIRRWRNEDTST